MDVKATTRCINCGDEFANHEYVKDSIVMYKCPHPHVECGYGFFHGGDPRDFSPDHECCTPEEIQRHKEACEVADKMDSVPDLPCPSGWERLSDGSIAHVLRAPFGIGTYMVKCDQFFEAADEPESEADDE